jgi:hypothetical protein
MGDVFGEASGSAEHGLAAAVREPTEGANFTLEVPPVLWRPRTRSLLLDAERTNPIASSSQADQYAARHRPSTGSARILQAKRPTSCRAERYPAVVSECLRLICPATDIRLPL